MNIAISANEKNIGENNLTIFCGCDVFLIIDAKANSLIALDNKNKGRPSEMVRTAGKLVSNQGVDAVIASEIGPQALDVFDRHGIKVY